MQARARARPRGPARANADVCAHARGCDNAFECVARLRVNASMVVCAWPCASTPACARAAHVRVHVCGPLRVHVCAHARGRARVSARVRTRVRGAAHASLPDCAYARACARERCRVPSRRACPCPPRRAGARQGNARAADPAVMVSAAVRRPGGAQTSCAVWAGREGRRAGVRGAAGLRCRARGPWLDAGLLSRSQAAGLRQSRSGPCLAGIPRIPDVIITNHDI